jgi:hypothetical protein
LLGEVLCILAGRIRCWLGRHNFFPGLDLSRVFARSVRRDEIFGIFSGRIRRNKLFRVFPGGIWNRLYRNNWRFKFGRIFSRSVRRLSRYKLLGVFTRCIRGFSNPRRWLNNRLNRRFKLFCIFSGGVRRLYSRFCRLFRFYDWRS